MGKDIVSDYHLERFVLGELPLDLDKKMRWMTSVDPEVRAAVAAIETSNRDILTLHPPPAFKAELLARMRDSGRGRKPTWRLFDSLRRGWLVPLSTALAALVLLLIFLVPGARHRLETFAGRAGGDESRVKGIEAVDTTKTQLLVFRRTKGRAEILGDENRARAGDLLQLAYVAAGDPFGVILSVDGRGQVTLHYPLEAGGSTALVQNRKFLLPNAIELDDAPSFERFILVTAKHPIDVASLLSKAGALAADPGEAGYSDLELPEDFDQFSVLILKGEDS